MLSLSTSAWAETPPDAILRVTRPIMHTGQDKVELCLEFDRTLNASPRKAPLSLHLKEGKKSIPITHRDVNIAANQLCLPPLDYQRDYTLSLNGVRGSNNEKLAGTYTLPFTTPERPPLLAFTNSDAVGTFLRWQGDDITLRAVNVAEAHVELYRITTMESRAAAWDKRHHAALVPSESTYFAKNNGELVWNTTITFNPTANKSGEKIIPLRGIPDLGSGLYLLSVSAHPKDSTTAHANKLVPQAAQWLLRSDIRINALRHGNNLSVFATDEAGKSSAQNITMHTLDANYASLEQSITNNDGIATIPISTKNKETMIMATSPKGDVDFLAILDVPTPTVAPEHPKGEIQNLSNLIITQKTATVTLVAPPSLNKKDTIKDSTLHIRRNDGGIPLSIPVTEFSGTTPITFTAPAVVGTWNMVWQRADGSVLAEQSFRTASTTDAPNFTLTAEHKIIDPDDGVNITITSKTAQGSPAPFVAGTVTATWKHTNRLFPDWYDYHFGAPDADVAPKPETTVAVLTDAKGMARIHIPLSAPYENAAALEAAITLRPDAASEAAPPPPLTIPLRPQNIAVGIKTLGSNGSFAENSTARFSVIAVDSNGKRVASDDLSYHIYDEGRSFEWYQADGVWNYKPLQRLRHLGGRPLTITASNDAIIEWPVTAGSYHLDIVDADNNILVRTNFNAGWRHAQIREPNILPLNAPDYAPYGQPVNINVTLNQASMLGIAINNKDRSPFLQHKAFPAGTSSFSFTPDRSWGNTATVFVTSASHNATAEAHISLGTDTKKTAHPAPTSISTPRSTSIPTTLTLNDTVTLEFDVPNASRHNTLTTGAGLKLVSSKYQGNRLIATLAATQTGTWPIGLDTPSAQGTKAQHTWQVIVSDTPRIFSTVSKQKFPYNDTLSYKPAFDAKGRAIPQLIMVGAAPLYDAPALLTQFLATPPTSTRDLADTIIVLKQWRNVINGSGMLSEAALQERLDTFTSILLKRQNDDGSFPSMLNGDGDVASTAMAIVGLTHGDTAITEPAIRHAGTFIKRHLDNTWFAEEERPVRATGYYALAMAHMLDAASLHYFSDTSAGKDLPPESAAALAAAFTHLKDRDAANFWIGKTGFDKNADSLDAETLAILNSLPSIRIDDTDWLLQKLSKQNLTTFARHDAANLLRALWAMHDRAEEWRLTINGTEKTLRHAFAFDATGKNTTLRHKESKPLTVIEARSDSPSKADIPTTITRTIYDTDGTLIDPHGALKRGQRYLVVLEGAGIQKDTATAHHLIIHDNPYPLFTPTGCAISPRTQWGHDLQWITNLTLMHANACEKTGRGITITDTLPKTNDKPWRYAYFAISAWEGVFNDPRATAGTDAQPIAQTTPATTWRVKK